MNCDAVLDLILDDSERLLVWPVFSAGRPKTLATVIVQRFAASNGKFSSLKIVI